MYKHTSEIQRSECNWIFEKIAKKYINRILEKRPKYFPARMLEGRLALLQKKYDKAADIFSQLASEEPKSSTAHYFRGIACFTKGEINNSKASLTKAIELNPNFIKARFLLADIYMNEQRFDLARKEAEKVISAWFNMDNVQPVK